MQGLARAEGVPPGRANREAMPDLTAKRTLVKSPPELWSELSEVERLARHLGAFGEIKITRLEPEHTVAWEGESASGTVSIEPSGWGTKVTLTAQLGECEESVASGAGVEEPPAAETAAGEGERDVPGGGEPEAAEAVVDEQWVGVPLSERAETVVIEEPVGDGRVAGGPAEAEPVTEEPGAEHSVADEPESGHVVDDEPDSPQPVPDEPESPQPVPSEPESAPPAVEDKRVTPHAAGPIQAKPRRKRGFLAWLFRPRTSMQVAPPPAATPPAATPSEPVGQAHVVAEEPVPAAEPVVAEGPRLERAPVVETSSVVEEAPVVEETPADETPAEEPSAPEEAPPPDEPFTSEEPRAPALDERMVDQPPPSSEEPVRVRDETLVAEGPPQMVKHEIPAAEGDPLMAYESSPGSGEVPCRAEESPESEDPALAEELAPEHSSPRPGLDPERAQAILDEALDALGSAHHRPFSRG
jgi:hypothetical protein